MGDKATAAAARRAVAREVFASYAYVGIWMSISVAVIMFNKWLLAFSGFPYPIALTMWHMAFCSTVAFLAVRVFGVVQSHRMSAKEYCRRVMPIGARGQKAAVCVCVCVCAAPLAHLFLHSARGLICGAATTPHPLNPFGEHPFFNTPPPFPFPHQRLALPAGLLYAGSLWLSNSAYLYLSVSFIQMTKSLMPGLVYACGCAVGTERFRQSAALNMLLIAAGVAVCALGEVNLAPIGLMQQLAALGFEAMRLTLVQVSGRGEGETKG